MRHWKRYPKSVCAPLYCHHKPVVSAYSCATFCWFELWSSHPLAANVYDQCRPFLLYLSNSPDPLDKHPHRSLNQKRKILPGKLLERNGGTVSLTSPKLSRFACLRNSVNAYRSFILRTRLPPRFFLLPSIGFGSGLANLTGGGSCSLSNFFSMSSLNRRPISPWTLSWQASTRAANVHLLATRRAALRRRSWQMGKIFFHFLGSRKQKKCFDSPG